MALSQPSPLPPSRPDWTQIGGFVITLAAVIITILTIGGSLITKLELVAADVSAIRREFSDANQRQDAQLSDHETRLRNIEASERAKR